MVSYLSDTVLETSPAVPAPVAGALAAHVIAFRVKAGHCIVCPGSLSNRDTDADGVYSVKYCGYILWVYTFV